MDGMTETFPASGYKALLDAIGTTTLGNVILDLAKAVTGVDEIFGFWIGTTSTPVPLASAGDRGSSRVRASMYATEFHRLDPLLPAIRDQQHQVNITAASIDIEDLGPSDYRRDCFERPGLRQKVAYFQREGDRCYVLVFYRTSESRRIDVNDLAGLAELVLPMLRRHGELLGEEAGMTLIERLERRIARSYPLLTGREREVCARTIAGMTAEATALSLDIGETSVLTYRRRACQRYQVAGMGQFIERLLD